MSEGGSGVFLLGPDVGGETMAALAEAVPGFAELGRGLGEAVFLTSGFVPFVLTLFSALLPFWTAPFGVGDAPFVGVTDPPFITFFAGFGVFLSSMKGISATTVHCQIRLTFPLKQENVPSHFSKNVSVLCHPRGNALVVCTVLTE